MITSKHQTLVLVILVTLLLTLLAIGQYAEAGGACFAGSSKGVKWENNEPHHYVQFRVDVNNAGWRVSGPLWPSVWGYYTDRTVRAGYSWPYNWWDPYPASWWRVCRN
ncbi:MAG: hypothetical protein K1X65_00890 [Caldilineales bacterium]|nr:hypothetical protein [Caldilineales bacterium]MCW5857452.1 hypothetical protein [Caldilineales bacterium]